MKLQYCFDLHLEFTENSDFLESFPIIPKGDILLLAGDIIPFRSLTRAKAFFDFVSANFKNTYWLPGNHEYYSFDAANELEEINNRIPENIQLLNNQVVELDEVRIIFSTLWSHISRKNEWTIQQRLSDFHTISFNKKPLTPNQYNQFHETSKTFLRNALAVKTKKRTVIVTHHVPTFMNYPEKYRGDILNQAFASEMFDFIHDSQIDFWIYGHHHSNIAPFKIGKTTLLTNQLGYVCYDEHKMFNSEALIVL